MCQHQPHKITVGMWRRKGKKESGSMLKEGKFKYI